MNWINCKERKPEGEVFWALTEGRPENDGYDWVIRKLINDDLGDYRSLDFATAFRLPDSYNGQHWQETIYAWLPIEAIPINDKAFQ